MTKQGFTNIIVLIFLILMSVVFASAQEPKTVTDFYYLLPKDAYFYPFDGAGGKKYRKSIIEIEDVKNGYLRVHESNTVESWSEVAIFKKTNGKYIVGISEVSCQQGCRSEETFLSYENGKWKDE